MNSPKVSFIVPCYKLASFLPACLGSILQQTCKDFEILVMDDCSPDNTAEVMKSYDDARIRYIRNDPNLGHLRNYNKGIGLCRGAYIWLISADDYLRSPYILERYTALLDSRSKVGYVFCPGFGVRDGRETEVFGQLCRRMDRDRVLSGETLLSKLLHGNFVAAPSGLARRECYEKAGAFPLDMPWCGDWYLWCLFALYFEVGYFAEPMVCYREQHPLSMTDKLTRESIDGCAEEEIRLSWRIRDHALQVGTPRIAKQCLAAIARTYARTIAGERFRNASTYMNFNSLEKALLQLSVSQAERDWIRARVYAGVGNECYWRQDLRAARSFYSTALAQDPWMPSVALKLLLASLGRSGDFLRRAVLSLR